MSWNAKSSALKKGDELTVGATDGTTFWAKVSEDCSAGSVFVSVEDVFRVEHSPRRDACHHRVVKSVAHITVSNDKDHDTWFTQETMRKQAAWCKTQDQFPGLATQITDHIIRSDGAGSHFKNKFTFHSLGDDKTRHGLRAVSWDIGCPGHGKGKGPVPRLCFFVC